MIKIKKLFSISPYYSEFELPLLCQNNNDNNNFTSMFTTPRSWKNIHFCFPATFTTAWLWQKKHCFDFTVAWTTLRLLDFFLFILILRSLRHGQDEKRFSFQYSVHYDMATEKINLIFITPLLWLRSIMKKNILLFDLTFTFFHDQKKKKLFFIYPLQSLCIHLLTSLTSTSGVLDDLLPVLVVLTPALNESF